MKQSYVGIYDFMAVCIAVTFFAVYIFSTARFPTSDIIFKSPLENLSFNFIKNIHETGSIQYDISNLPSITNLGKDDHGLYSPRDGAVSGSSIVPQDSLGIYVLGYVVNNPNLLVFINPLASAAILLLVYCLSRELFGKTSYIPLAAMLLCATLPVFWFQASRIVVSDIFASLFFVSMVYAYVLSKKNRAWSYVAIYMALLSIMFRYTNLLFIAPLITYLLIKNYHYYFERYKLSLAALLLLLLTALPVLHINNQLYGGPLKTGYSLSYENIAGSTGTNTSLVQFDTSNIANYMDKYLLSLNPLIFVLFIIGFTVFYSKVFNQFKWYAGLTFIIISIYFGSRVTWGLNTDNAYIDASFSRYMLPVLILMVVIGSLTLTLVSRRIQLLILSCTLIFSSWLALFGKSGVVDTLKYGNSQLPLKQNILNSTDDESVIIVTQFDKVLFPDRSTIATGLLASGANQGETRIWDLKPNLNQLSSVTAQLKNSDKSVYFLDEMVVDVTELNQSISSHGYTMQPTPVQNLYMVVRK